MMQEMFEKPTRQTESQWLKVLFQFFSDRLLRYQYFSARLSIAEEFELQIDLGKTAEARSATLVYLENNLQPHATVRGA